MARAIQSPGKHLWCFCTSKHVFRASVLHPKACAGSVIAALLSACMLKPVPKACTGNIIVATEPACLLGPSHEGTCDKLLGPSPSHREGTYDKPLRDMFLLLFSVLKVQTLGKTQDVSALAHPMEPRLRCPHTRGKHLYLDHL